MAQLFDNTTADFLSRADLTGARFLIGETWSLCAFIRIETFIDDRMWFCKWFDTSRQQFRVRTDSGAAPQAIEVGTNNVQLTLNFGSVELNTWYMIVISNDGAGGATGISGFQYEMDGNLTASLSDQHDGDISDPTANLLVGVRGDVEDPFDGDIAYVAYFNTELTAAERLAYLRNPYQVVFSKGSAGVEFFLPIYGDASPEPELVHGRDFTVNGSQVKGTNPPLGPFAKAVGGIVAGSTPSGANSSSLGFMVPQ